MVTISQKKPEGVVRITFKNINSVGVLNKKRAKNSKPVLFSNMGDNFDVDVMCHVEPQKNWDLVDKDLQYDQLFGPGRDAVAVAAHNEHYKIFDQYGGTAMITRGKMSAYAKAGKDTLGLGRVVWTVFNYNGHKLRVVTAYRPCQNTKEQTKGNKLSHSVWRQHY